MLAQFSTKRTADCCIEVAIKGASITDSYGIISGIEVSSAYNVYVLLRADGISAFIIDYCTWF